MESPFPMVITKAKDGTYIEANKTAMRFWGWPRKQIIGHQSTELGVISPEQRNKFTHEIKKQGFAKDIPFEASIKNKGILHISFNIFPIKMGKETFFLSIGTDAFNYQTILKKHRHEKFFKLTAQDAKSIRAKLKRFQLTPRQQEIAILAAAGDANRIIAKKLELSEYTVKDHIKDIFKILGIKNRSELFPKLLNLR